VELNKEYATDIDSGLFIIAFPNLDKDATELAFNYWVEAKKVPTLVPWHQFEGEQGETIFMLICLLALTQLLCITCVCCYYCCKSRQLKKQIGVEREKLEEQELEIQNPKGESGNSAGAGKAGLGADEVHDAGASKPNGDENDPSRGDGSATKNPKGYSQVN